MGNTSEYKEKLKDCYLTAGSLFNPLQDAMGTLVVQWLKIVSQVQSSPSVEASVTSFRSCVEGDGVPENAVSYTSSSDAFDGFLAWVTGIETHSKGQRGWTMVNEQWVPVFVRCAGPTVALQQKLQLHQQVIFMRSHAVEIANTVRLADQTTTALERKYGNVRV
jgi:hypothetical protein